MCPKPGTSHARKAASRGSFKSISTTDSSVGLVSAAFLAMADSRTAIELELGSIILGDAAIYSRPVSAGVNDVSAPHGNALFKPRQNVVRPAWPLIVVEINR